MLPQKQTKKVHFDLPADYPGLSRTAPSPLSQPQPIPVSATSTSSAVQRVPSAAVPVPAARPQPPIIPSPAHDTSHLPLITTTAPDRPRAIVPATQPMGNVPSARPAPPALAVAKSQDKSVALASSHPTLNPLLRPRSDLMYNMLYDPSIAYATGGTLLPWQQEQPVTKKPEIVRMHIVVDFPHAATAPVHMRPTGLFLVESPRQKSLQVCELLRGIHAWLHGPAERDDWARVTQEQRDIATHAFYARAHTPEERARGVRRIDWFGEHTFFGGIAPFDAPAEMWRLTLVPAALAAPRR